MALRRLTARRSVLNHQCSSFLRHAQLRSFAACRCLVHNTSAEDTDFGFQQVPIEKKASLVRDVFDSVASKYDIMNDLMSAGIHRVWKDHLIHGVVKPFPGMDLLDLAGGTGDIAFRVLKHLSTSRGCKSSSVTVCDINENMLAVGEERWKREGYADLAAARQVNFSWVIGDAMQLPFESNSFDAVTIAFGLRNVTDKQKSLDEMHRVLKRGGALYCLEFSQVDNVILKQFYDLYSFQVLPTLGSAVTGDSDSYRYLVESIRRFPEATALKEMMESAGFNCSSFEKLTGGVVAVHLGFKL